MPMMSQLRKRMKKLIRSLQNKVMTKNPNRNQFSKESMLYQIKILRSFQMNGK